MTRSSGISLPLAPSQGYIAAFSTVEKAAAFMFRRGDTEWRMKLVSRPTLQETLESLRAIGARGLAFNPEDDGTGTLIDFEKLDRI
jgi:hypothetical protein